MPNAILTETLACFLPGRAKDLSTPRFKLHANTKVQNIYARAWSICDLPSKWTRFQEYTKFGFFITKFVVMELIKRKYDYGSPAISPHPHPPKTHWTPLLWCGETSSPASSTRVKTRQTPAICVRLRKILGSRSFKVKVNPSMFQAYD